MSGQLGFFHMEQARIEAEGHGFEWDGDLQQEIHKWRGLVSKGDRAAAGAA